MGDKGFDGLTIGERIDSERRKRGYKVEDISFEMNLSTSYVRKLLHGQFEWKEEYLKSLAEFFDLDLGYLMTGRYMVDKPAEQIEFKERIKYDVDFLKKLAPDDRLEHMAIILETAANVLRNK